MFDRMSLDLIRTARPEDHRALKCKVHGARRFKSNLFKKLSVII